MARTNRISPSGKAKMVTKTVTFDVASSTTLTAVDESVTVPGAAVGDAILATPRGTWDAGLMLGPNRCAVAGTVLMRVANTTVGNINPASQSFGFLLVKGGTLRFSPSGPVKVLFRDVTVVNGSIDAATAADTSVAVPGAKVGDFIIATPLGTLDAGLGFGPHRCAVAGTVLLRIGNATVDGQALASQTVRFCLIRPSRTARKSPSGAANIIEHTVTVDVANVVTRTAVDTSVAVPGVEVGDAIIATPLGAWPAGLVLGPHRCAVAGTVLMRVYNGTAGGINPDSQSFRFTIIKQS